MASVPWAVPDQQLPWGDAAVEMRGGEKKKRHFMGFVLLFVSDTLIARFTTTSSSSLPHPLPNKIFTLWVIFV